MLEAGCRDLLPHPKRPAQLGRCGLTARVLWVRVMTYRLQFLLPGLGSSPWNLGRVSKGWTSWQRKEPTCQPHNKYNLLRCWLHFVLAAWVVRKWLDPKSYDSDGLRALAGLRGRLMEVPSEPEKSHWFFNNAVLPCKVLLHVGE